MRGGKRKGAGRKPGANKICDKTSKMDCRNEIHSCLKRGKRIELDLSLKKEALYKVFCLRRNWSFSFKLVLNTIISYYKENI